VRHQQAAGIARVEAGARPLLVEQVHDHGAHREAGVLEGLRVEPRVGEGGAGGVQGFDQEDADGAQAVVLCGGTRLSSGWPARGAAAARAAA